MKKKYRINLNLDGDKRVYHLELDSDFTEDESKEAIEEFVKELFYWDYEEVINEGY